MERFNGNNSPISEIIMLEIRFHGRGGQGTVVASILLAKAFFDAGYYVQTFPLFGVERRGAPVEAYLRLDKKKILIRSNIYTPDHIIVQDVPLFEQLSLSQNKHFLQNFASNAFTLSAYKYHQPHLYSIQKNRLPVL